MTCGCINVVEDTVPLDSLMRFVAAAIPEIPYEVGLEYIRQAYTTFARRTGLLAYDLKLQMQRDVKEYILTPPDGYEIFGIMQRCQRTYGYIVFANAHRWFDYAGERMHMVGNDRLVLENPSHTNDRTLEIGLHLIPSECADTIPREISTPYGSAIAKGAMCELLDMPNKGWSDPRTAARYRNEFNNAILSGRNLYLTNRGNNKVMMDQIRVI